MVRQEKGRKDMLIRDLHERRCFGEVGEVQGPFEEQQVFWFECNSDVIMKVHGCDFFFLIYWHNMESIFLFQENKQ